MLSPAVGCGAADQGWREAASAAARVPLRSRTPFWTVSGRRYRIREFGSSAWSGRKAGAVSGSASPVPPGGRLLAEIGGRGPARLRNEFGISVPVDPYDLALLRTNHKLFAQIVAYAYAAKLKEAT